MFLSIYFQKQLTTLYDIPKTKYSPQCTIYHWDVEIMMLNQERFLIFQDTNDTGYCFVCNFPGQIGMNRFKKFFIDHLTTQLAYEGFSIKAAALKKCMDYGCYIHSYFVNGRPSRSLLATSKIIQNEYVNNQNLPNIVASLNACYYKGSRMNPDQLSSSALLNKLLKMEIGITE